MCAVNPLILTFRDPSEEQVAAFPQSRAHHSQQDSATDPGLWDSLATGSFLNGHHHNTAAKSPKCEIERPRQKIKGSWRKNKEEKRIEVKKPLIFPEIDKKMLHPSNINIEKRPSEKISQKTRIGLLKFVKVSKNWKIKLLKMSQNVKHEAKEGKERQRRREREREKVHRSNPTNRIPRKRKERSCKDGDNQWNNQKTIS